MSNESGERVSDEQLDARRISSLEDWIADGVEHESLPLRDVLSLFRELQRRRSTDTRTEVLEGEKPVTRRLVEFMAELREKREAEVRVAALEEAAKVCEPFFKDKHVGAAAVTIRDLIRALKANTPPPREGE